MQQVSIARQILDTLGQLGDLMGRLIGLLFEQGLAWSLVLFWLAWWLAAVNWKKAWPVLAEGAWAPLVLLGILVALVWSQVMPSSLYFSWGPGVPNFWWHCGAVALGIGSALFCGWLQGLCGCTPAEVPIDPPGHSAAEGHASHAAH